MERRQRDIESRSSGRTFPGEPILRPGTPIEGGMRPLPEDHPLRVELRLAMDAIAAAEAQAYQDAGEQIIK